MTAPQPLAYGRAAVVAAYWCAGALAAAFALGWLRTRIDPGRQYGFEFLMLVLGMFVVLPLVAGVIHRSLRVVTMTAVIEAVVLGLLMLAALAV